MYSNNPPMRGIANSMAQHGRYGDSMLVHMNPHEVQGIAALSPTGKLTTNPITGQPEAFLPFLAPLLGSMFGSTMLGGLGSALGGTALGTALTSAAGMPALAGAIGSGLATTAVTGDLEKGIMSGLTGFGLGQALGAAGEALNPQIGETAAALGDASTAASEAGQNLASIAAETTDPIAKAIEMGAVPATNPLTGELVNQAFSPAAVTDPLTGELANQAFSPAATALNPSQIAMADPMQKLLGAEGVKSAADAKVASLSKRLSSLRGDQTAGDKILAPFKQPGVFGKQFLEPGVLAPIAIGEGQRAQMEAVEKAEEENRWAEREREEEYQRNMANMVGAYDQLELGYPGYEVARDSQYAAAGGITSIDPNNYMDNIKGLQRLAGGGVVKMPFGGSIPRLKDTEISNPGAAARQAGIRGTEVISPEELAGYRPGFSPEINYFRTPVNPNEGGGEPVGSLDIRPGGGGGSGWDGYNNFNFADWANTEAGGANRELVSTPSAAENRNIPTFDRARQAENDARMDAALREMIAANSQNISNTPSFDDSALREMIAANSQQIQNAPSFDGSRFNFGVGEAEERNRWAERERERDYRRMAEGRLVENELADESMLETKETNGQLVIERAVMAISGQLSPEDSEAAVNVFLDEFGPEAFQFLRKKVLQDIVPGAQVEGEVSGTGAGMDDEVVGMIGDQQPIAVSPGEYIVPADVVSGIGDGSTDAGAGELDEMLERVRMERTGTTEQPQPMRRGGGLPA